MRKCALHGTELNCRTNVIGECPGILHGVMVDEAPILDDGEAADRLGRQPTRDEAKAQLVDRGVPPEVADEMLDAPGSPYATR